jgi:hypothetical protein
MSVARFSANAERRLSYVSEVGRDCYQAEPTNTSAGIKTNLGVYEPAYHLIKKSTHQEEENAEAALLAGLSPVTAA